MELTDAIVRLAPGRVRAALLQYLDRAFVSLGAAQAPGRAGKNALRRAEQHVRRVKHSLRSLAARRDLDPTLRPALVELVEALRRDLHTLRLARQ